MYIIFYVLVRGVAFIYFVFIANLLLAQNLVPNPGFEDTTVRGIPSSYNDWDWVKTWYNPANGTPDLMHRLSPNYMSGISCVCVCTSDNWLGAEDPHGGDAYAAIHMYTRDPDGTDLQAKEYIGVKLLQPLQVGRKYRIGFFLSSCDRTWVVGNGISMLLTTEIYPNPPGSVEELTADPQIYTPKVIQVETGWEEKFQVFTADKPYQYITIGCFYKYDDPRFRFFWKTQGSHPLDYLGSYYVDDVSVVPVHLQKPFLGNDTTVCRGQKVVLSAGVEAQYYQWSTGETTEAITVQDSGFYQVTATYFDESRADTIHVSTLPLPEVQLVADTSLCPTDSIYIPFDAGHWVSQTWNNGDTSRVIIAHDFGSYTVNCLSDWGCYSDATVRVLNGCPACVGDFSIYPNPAINTFNIGIIADGAYNDISLKIVDDIGKICSEGKASVHKGKNTLSIDVTLLASGKYYLIISSLCGQNAVPFITLKE